MKNITKIVARLEELGFQQIGKGSDRVVLETPQGNVLKLAICKGSLIQNKNEATFNGVTPHAKILASSEDYSLLLQERHLGVEEAIEKLLFLLHTKGEKEMVAEIEKLGLQDYFTIFHGSLATFGLEESMELFAEKAEEEILEEELYRSNLAFHQDTRELLSIDMGIHAGVNLGEFFALTQTGEHKEKMTYKLEDVLSFVQEYEGIA